jgi:O-antigen/teichoic acid export membrane protein
MTHTPLRARIIQSMSWSVSGAMLAQALRLGSSLVMTRLLFPSDFGLMAIVQVLLFGLTLMSDIGTHQSLIYHHKGEDAAFRSTAWTVQVLRGIGIWLLSLVAALFFLVAAHLGYLQGDSAYADPRLPWVIAVCCFQSVIQGFNSSKSALAQRKLDLKRMTLLQLYSQVGSLLFMVAWGYMVGGISTLVVGSLMATLIQTCLSHWYLPGEPDKLGWNKEAAADLWSFGRWVFVSSALTFLASGGDRLLLGGLEDAKTVGVYVIAFSLLTPIPTIFLMITGTIMFPALSEVHRQSPERVGEVYLKFQRYADLVLFGSAGILIMIAPQMVRFLYDSRYHEAGWMLSLLAVGLIGWRFHVLEQVFKAKGESGMATIANVLRFVGLFCSIPLAHHWGGLPWAIGAIALSPLMAWPLGFWYRHKQGLPSLRADAWAIPALLAGLGVGWMLQRLLALVGIH